jgi:hypothetical protein
MAADRSLSPPRGNIVTNLGETVERFQSQLGKSVTGADPDLGVAVERAAPDFLSRSAPIERLLQIRWRS